MYDDHEYCEKCDKHSIKCWCRPDDEDSCNEEHL